MTLILFFIIILLYHEHPSFFLINFYHSLKSKCIIDYNGKLPNDLEIEISSHLYSI
jgi:hypothetical protein